MLISVGVSTLLHLPCLCRVLLFCLFVLVSLFHVRGSPQMSVFPWSPVYRKKKKNPAGALCKCVCRMGVWGRGGTADMLMTFTLHWSCRKPEFSHGPDNINTFHLCPLSFRDKPYNLLLGSLRFPAYVLFKSRMLEWILAFNSQYFIKFPRISCAFDLFCAWDP